MIFFARALQNFRFSRALLVGVLFLSSPSSFSQVYRCEDEMYRFLLEIEASSAFNPSNFFNPKSNPLLAGSMGAVSWSVQNYAMSGLKNRALEELDLRLRESGRLRKEKDKKVKEIRETRAEIAANPKKSAALNQKLNVLGNSVQAMSRTTAYRQAAQLTDVIHQRATASMDPNPRLAYVGHPERVGAAAKSGLRGFVYGIGTSLMNKQIALKYCGGEKGAIYVDPLGPSFNLVDGCHISYESVKTLLESEGERYRLCQLDPKINGVWPNILKNSLKIDANKSVFVNNCTGGELGFRMETPEGQQVDYEVLVHPGSHLEIKVSIPPNEGRPFNETGQPIQYTFDYTPGVLPNEMFGLELRNPRGFRTGVGGNGAMNMTGEHVPNGPYSFVQNYLATLRPGSPPNPNLTSEVRGQHLVGESLIRGINTVAVLAPACLTGRPLGPPRIQAPAATTPPGTSN